MQTGRAIEEPTEEEPLLGHVHDVSSPKHFLSGYQRLLLLVGISIVAADFGNALTVAPQIAIFESLICYQPGGGGDCKSPEVQGELALLIGWKDTIDQLPGIILALPYGLAADRFGRKPILLLCLAGLVLEEVAIRLVCWWNAVIPLRMIWVTPIFQIIGGGSQTATAMAYAMITDVVPLEKRASIFYIMAAVVLLGEILATPISAFLMMSSPWVPTLLGVVVQLGGLLAAAFVSETRPDKCPKPDQPTNTHERQEGLQWAGGGGDGTGQDCPRSMYQYWKHTVSEYWKHLQGAGGNGWDLNMAYIVGTFLLASIGKQALQLIIPYASNRFMWSIPRASFLVTFKGVINLITLLLILPWLSAKLSRQMSWSPAVKDLRVVQGSSSILTLGALLMALAAQPSIFVAGVCLFGFGWGFYSALRSLATALVSPSQVGVLNSGIGLAQGIGSLVAGPILAAAFRQGLRQEGFGKGLPYLVAGALFFSASAFTCLIRITREEKPSP
ncbi:major facilitator superfamily domain-containing protein [Aspergillus pseudonomiae]|uniref:Major facilitator superfamily domain-containing protein n=1 Tax=Aspergillus pseudonomiae TaxID=1506151 RepID=A0A5N7CVX8_9EURO|nr:major facilitator superfamily domain-containing protein [Aspergillus pseudonomiae]KAB8257987.1 major facilitator superfamily domain-containing protein [Aspergillus pseudonomiae]KAE8397768.1 major facilitator superfamily domain-containing protein [Aspergillus pseudonomiae]